MSYHDHSALVNGAAILNDEQRNLSDSFVYYVPQANGLHTHPQDEYTQDRNNIEQSITQNNRTITNQAEGRNTTSKPVIVDLTLDDSDDNDDQLQNTQGLPQNTFPKILAAYSLNENTPFPHSDLSQIINRKVQESRAKEDDIVVDSLVLNTTKPNGLLIESTSSQLTRPIEIVDTSTLTRTMDHSNVSSFNRTSLAGHSTLTSSSRTSLSGHSSPVASVSRMRHSSLSSRTGLAGHSTPVPNGSVDQHLNSLRFKPNGQVFDSRPKTHNFQHHDQNTSLPKNGLRNYSDDVNTLINQSRTGIVRNDVMHDVTNTRGTHIHEYRPLTFSSWGKTTDTRSPVTTPNDSDDNVLITKVVTPTDKSRGRTKHPRKTPISVRQWSPEESQPITEQPEKTAISKLQAAAQQLNTRKRSLETSLQDVVAKKRKLNSSSSGDMHREAKIRTLKNLLAKQEKAVEKIRTKDNIVPTDRILVVEIPDLKSELHIPNDGKHSFRVSSQTITISPKDNDSPRKRPRKRDPRKINRQEDRYPSYVETKQCNGDDLVAAKRFKGKQKGAKGKSRGRNSPKPSNNIPVVVKDVWHREMEKVEAKLALTNGPIDQASFMLFLGLKKV